MTTACFLAVQRQQHIDSLVTTLSNTTGEYDRLAAQLTALEEKAERAAEETRALRRQNRALLDYLRELGIDVPRTLAERGGGDEPAPKGSGPQGPKPTSQPSPTPASPAPSATPSPTGSLGIADVICSLLPPSVPCLLPS